MGAASQLLSLPGLTLASAVEALLAIKLVPEYWGPHGHLRALGATLAFNSAFGVIFWTIIYPRLLSPLRRIKGPKVSFTPTHKFAHFSPQVAGTDKWIPRTSSARRTVRWR